MNKTIVALSVLGIAVIAAIILVPYIFRADEASIRARVQQEYPGSDPVLEHLEDCLICGDGGCNTYPSPCWVATVIKGNDSVSIVMDESGSEVGRETGACNGWWCDAEPCRYTFSEGQEPVVEYTNLDCRGDDLVCDQDLGRCRDCITGEECIGTTVINDQGEYSYRYEVLSTGEYASIGPDGLCRIYSRGSLIYESPSDPSSCGQLMKGNTQCYDGSCDFVPEFALIPS